MEKRRVYLKVNIVTFLLFEMLFRSILVVLLTTGIGNIVDILLRFQGYSYVTHGNYLKFMRHPVSVVGISAFLLISLFLILFEFCGLFLLLDAGKKEMKVHFSDLLIQSWRNAFGFVKRHPVLWILYMLVCLPNLYLHMLVWEIDRAKFIDIIVQDICGVIGIPAFVVLMLLYFLFAVLASQVLPYRIFEKGRTKDVRTMIRQALAGNRVRELLITLWIHLRVFLVTGVVFVISVLGAVAGIRMFRPVNRYVSDALFYGSILKLLIGTLIGFLGTVMIVGFLFNCFTKTGGSIEEWECSCKVRSKKIILTMGTVLAGILIVFEAFQYIPDITEAQAYMEITAHRGGAKFAPENTLAAIRYAIDTKADYAEIDVQETKDGEVVLLHDNWLARTTGLRKYIWDVSYDEVAALDAGSYFSTAFKGERIPTLREVIQACQGKIRLNIEIKANGFNNDIAEKVVRIIQEENFTANCVVTSMDYKFLKQVKEVSSDIVTGYTLNMVYGKVEDLDAADFYSVKHTYINKRFVEKIHQKGKKVCAWTLNNRAPIRKVIDSGVDNVITDNPELVRREIMQEYEKEPEFLSLVKYAIQ